MAHLVTGPTITDAWLSALRLLVQEGPQVFDLMVTVEDPSPGNIDTNVVSALNDILVERSCRKVETVINTIFPVAIAATSHDRDELYRRYTDLLPRIKREVANRRGTYFARLINYPLQTDPQRANQLECIITDLQAQLKRRGPLGSVYEAQIFAPGKDRLPQGFPCMSSLSFQLDGSRLRLSATYRNQYFVQRALGNYLGLAHLQHFIASAAGLSEGSLSIHAFRGQIDPSFRGRAASQLLEACNGR
jgi:thymidylate synthase